MALAPWNVIAAGKIRTDEEEEKRRQTGEKGRTTFNPDWERNEDEKKMSKALEKVAQEVGAKHITAGLHLFCFYWFSTHHFILCSCYSLRDAKDAFRFPNHRRQKSRALDGEPRSLGHRPHA